MSAREVDRQAVDSASSRRGKPPSSRESGRELPHPQEPSALEGRYQSLFVLGRGGMGSVEAALEIRDDDDEAEKTDYRRVVALKRLLPDAARDARRAEMFLREARVAAMLDHPNVVRAFDYGDVDGEMFLAMEYVEGQPLSRVLRATADAKKRLTPALVAWILAEVCAGLHAAHELKGENGEPLNLVHRDISPQNVMLGYDGRVRLLDFGVAKIETENVTKTGEVKGKTAYMSPEQAMGEAIDRRSDLFGVGAILYECLALERMWGDGTDMEVIRKLALESPPALEKADPSAPRAMKDLYAKLVAREASARPATAREAGEALRATAAEDGAVLVRALLELHFANDAADQRERLTKALESVAPERASELRESVVPASAQPADIEARELLVSGERSVAVASTETRSATGRGPKLALAFLALTILAVIVWRSTLAPPEPQTTTAPPPTATPSATPSAKPEIPSTTPPATQTAPTATASVTPTSRPTVTTKPIPTVNPTVRPLTTTTVTAPAATSAPPPATTPTTKPSQAPNVDPNPI